MLRILTLVGAGALAIVSGCSVRAEPGPVVVPSDGSLTVDWTIDDTKDPTYCAHYAASSIQIAVTASDGADAGTYEQDCEAFQTTLSLPPGEYSATAVLIDSAGTHVTTTIDINPFRIVSGTDLNTPIDFPLSSFL